MNSFVGFKNFTQGMLFIALILVGVVFVCFIVVSIIGNIQLGCLAKEPEPPKLEKAKYRVDVKATRQIYYTDGYDFIEENDKDTYILRGYWELSENRYIYHDSDIILNEYYFGDIRVRKR